MRQRPHSAIPIDERIEQARRDSTGARRNTAKLLCAIAFSKATVAAKLVAASSSNSSSSLYALDGGDAIETAHVFV